MNALVIIISLIINLVFNYNRFWHELIFDNSKVGAVYGEVSAYEWGLETSYQSLIKGNNPFAFHQGVLYPFEIDFSPTDWGNGFLFPLLRPFLSPHQSLSIIVTLSIFFAGIGMYLLLKRFKFDKLVAFLISLAYAYMTFLTPRIGGHLNYTCHYLFPWFFYFAFSIFKNTKITNKLLSCLGAALFFCLTLWQNKYYFIILLIACFFLLASGFFVQKKLLAKELKKNWQYLLFALGAISLFLLPWLKAVYQASLFTETPRAHGWGGAITYSSDLLGFFIPSHYNPYYGSIVIKIIKNVTFAKGIFENYTYPGIIIFLAYFFLWLFWKKLPKKLKSDLGPFLITSLIFALLTLGPFLHIAGRWTLKLKEGISLVFPLPFIILHYLPFLGNIRAPGRLNVGFIFFAYIVCGYLLNYLFKKLKSKKKSQKLRVFVAVLFFLIFVIDQRYPDKYLAEPRYFPYKIFQEIKKDPEYVSVLEIPFNVRDGFTYFGDNDAVFNTVGQLIHQKPALGGYLGRIPHYIKEYYKNNLFFGYLGHLIAPAGQLDQKQPSMEKTQDTLDFLDTKYIILDENKPYVATASGFLKDLGFEQQMFDQHFSLWTRNPQEKEFLEINIGELGDSAFLGLGWQPIEENLRWVDRKSSVMFKIIKAKKMDLNFKAAAFYQEQPVAIFLNKQKVAQITISTQMATYSVPIKKEFLRGINTIHFIFAQDFRPNEIIPGSQDRRELAARFKQIYLTESNHD